MPGVSQSMKRATTASRKISDSEFQTELNPDGTPRDLEAALDKSDDKGHLVKVHGNSPPLPFKQWRDSRVLGKGTGVKALQKTLHPCFDASDKAVVSVTKFLRSSPTARVAGVTYWVVLHVWLFFLVLAHHGAASGIVTEVASSGAGGA